MSLLLSQQGAPPVVTTTPLRMLMGVGLSLLFMLGLQ